MTPALSDAQREAVEEQIDGERVNEQLRKRIGAGFQMAVNQRTREILSELDNRGIDTSRENVEVAKIAGEYAVKSLLNPDAVLERSNSEHETVENEPSSRTNGKRATDGVDGPKTYTVEVPVEGGEDPNTIEVERVDPGTDPRLNSELSPMERMRAFQDGIVPESALSTTRLNSDEESDTPVAGSRFHEDDDEMDSEDVRATSQRFNEYENDTLRRKQSLSDPAMESADESDQEDDDSDDGGDLPWYQ